jgi:hypothetical protein
MIFVIHGGDTSKASREDEKAPIVTRSSALVAASEPTLPMIPDGAIQNNTDLYHRFLSIYLPREERYTSRWLPNVPRGSDRPRILEIATQALSTMMMGQQTQDASILVNARNLYGQALISLRNRIEKPQPKSEWPQLLQATMILQIFEVRCSSGLSPTASPLLRLYIRGYRSPVYRASSITLLVLPCFLGLRALKPSRMGPCIKRC